VDGETKETATQTGWGEEEKGSVRGDGAPAAGKKKENISLTKLKRNSISLDVVKGTDF